MSKRRTSRKELKLQLSRRRIMFAREYVTDMNARRAASVTGFNPSEAQSVLSHHEVSSIVEYLAEERAHRLSIKADNVLREIARMAFANMKDYITVDDAGEVSIDLSNLTSDQTAAIQEITKTESEDGSTIRFKLADKRANLELLGRYLKLFDDGASKRPTQIQIINLVPRPDGDSSAITI